MKQLSLCLIALLSRAPLAFADPIVPPAFPYQWTLRNDGVITIVIDKTTLVVSPNGSARVLSPKHILDLGAGDAQAQGCRKAVKEEQKDGKPEWQCYNIPETPAAAAVKPETGPPTPKKEK